MGRNMVPDLHWITWTTEDCTRGPARVLGSRKAALATIVTVSKEARTFSNTIEAIERSGYSTADEINYLEVLRNVSTSKEVREAAQHAVDEIRKGLIDIYYTDELWQAISEYTEKSEQLEGQEAKLFFEMRREFERMGFGLPKEKREELKTNIKNRIELETTFSRNINEYRDAITATLEELDGMDERFIEGLKKNDEGKYLVGLDYPELVPFLGGAKNAAKRKELLDKNLHKGGAVNMEILEKVLVLRAKNAALLGYKNHADYATAVLMSKNGDTVRDFLTGISDKLKDATKRDYAELLEIKKQQTNDMTATLQYFDTAYYTEELQKQKFSIDSEKLREYFPLEHVTAQIFSIYSKLFSITIEEVVGVHLWHGDARMYRIIDSDGSTRAHFMLDIFPRDGKYTHACAMEIISAREENGDHIAPLGTLLMNFAAPTENAPSLLSHSDVETFFHEFGHLMHFCLGRTKYMSQNPFGVAWDFVEAPSQMLENWVWNKEALLLLSKHYQTGEPMPEATLDALVKSRSFMMATFTMKQMVYALFDYYLHAEPPRTKEEICKLFNRVWSELSGVLLPEDSIFPAGFGHLMGYDAKYYGYSWSRVFAADMFTRFEKEGVLHEKTGMDYRRFVLEPGASVDELTLVKNFLGREPNNQAFLKEIGIK